MLVAKIEKNFLLYSAGNVVKHVNSTSTQMAVRISLVAILQCVSSCRSFPDDSKQNAVTFHRILNNLQFKPQNYQFTS